MRAITIILIFLSMAVLAWFGLQWFERNNLYFPEKGVTVSPNDFGIPFEEVFLLTEDGNKIQGWFIPPAKRSDHSSPSESRTYTILFCHGNAGNIGHRIEKAQMLNKLGLNVFLFDYRGYGRSTGSPSEKGTYMDGTAAYKYLLETKKIPSDQIVFYGESLGGAIAVELAHCFKGAGLILSSPFTSVVEMGNHFFPWLPARWIVQNRYDNLAKIAEIKIPILVMHSPGDEVIPFEMGQKLYQAATGQKVFFEMTENHNEGYLQTGEKYTDAIFKFIKEKVAIGK